MPPVCVDNVHEVVQYHAPSQEQIDAISKIRCAVENLIVCILQNSPSCADQTAAIRKVREAMMTANAAIVLDGKV